MSVYRDSLDASNCRAEALERDLAYERQLQLEQEKRIAELEASLRRAARGDNQSELTNLHKRLERAQRQNTKDRAVISELREALVRASSRDFGPSIQDSSFKDRSPSISVPSCKALWPVDLISAMFYVLGFLFLVFCCALTCEVYFEAETPSPEFQPLGPAEMGVNPNLFPND